LGRGWFVSGRETVEVGGGCGMDSEVTVGELGEVGWGFRNSRRHVGCGDGDCWDRSRGSNSSKFGFVRV